MIQTPRLVLRTWTSSDRAPFARMNADPRVMEFFRAPLSPEESDSMVDRINQHQAEHGFTLFAAERRDTAAFIGFIGIVYVPSDMPFAPAIEIGWRLAAEHWGQGFATEGAQAVTRFAFDSLHLPELVAMTVPANLRSRRVMQKLGMTRNPADDFNHPRVPAGHPLRPHVLYRLVGQAILPAAGFQPATAHAECAVQETENSTAGMHNLKAVSGEPATAHAECAVQETENSTAGMHNLKAVSGEPATAHEECAVQETGSTNTQPTRNHRATTRSEDPVPETSHANPSSLT